MRYLNEEVDYSDSYPSARLPCTIINIFAGPKLDPYYVQKNNTE